MEQLLNRATAISDLAYLRIIQLVHVQTSVLIEDLKAYELPSLSPRSSETTELRRALTTTGPPTTAAVSTMLETAMEELFVPYTEGQRYLERESKSLSSLYSGLLVAFTRYHVGTIPHPANAY
jgi:exocyst complex component 5